VSERSRVSLPYLSELERGRKEASSEILSTVCVVLGLTEAELLRQTGAEFERLEASRREPERTPAGQVSRIALARPELVRSEFVGSDLFGSDVGELGADHEIGSVQHGPSSNAMLLAA
jgi:transcriptional regulator with XRE-family HTH domain